MRDYSKFKETNKLIEFYAKKPENLLINPDRVKIELLFDMARSLSIIADVMSKDFEWGNKNEN